MLSLYAGEQWQFQQSPLAPATTATTAPIVWEQTPHDDAPICGKMIKSIGYSWFSLQCILSKMIKSIGYSCSLYNAF